MEEFSLDNILSEETIPRSEDKDVSPDELKIEEDNGLEFEEAPLIEVEEFEEEPQKPYDAKTNAENLVNLIDAVNILSLTPLARWKLKKKRGGKEVLDTLEKFYSKKVSGAKVTDEEKEKAAIYEAYLKDTIKINEAIPFSADEKTRLITAAVPYLEKTQMKIDEGLGFWGILIAVEGSKVMQILTA